MANRIADDAEQLGRGIRRLRKERKWKQDVLALESCLNRSTISLTENAKSNLSLYELDLIATALGTTISGLLDAGRIPLRNTDEKLKSLFASNVRLRRESMGLSRTDVADSVGFLPQYISTTENARRLPALPNFLLLAKALRIEPALLLRENFDPNAFELGAGSGLDPENVVLRMVEVRRNAKLSQKEVARRCNIDSAQLSNIENGRHFPSLMTLVSFCRGMGHSLEQLLKIY